MTFARKNLAIFLIILCLFVITQWSSSVYLPIAPQIAQSFLEHQYLIVGSLSVFFFFYALGQLFWGILSDYLSRYLVLFSALLLYFVFELLIMSTKGSAVWFVCFLSMTGFAVSANTSVGNAIIKDIYGIEAKKMIGYVGIAMACAPVIAPIIGSSLYNWLSWQSIFGFLAVVGVLLAALFWQFFYFPNRNKNKKSGYESKIEKKEKTSLWAILKETFLDNTFAFYVFILSVTFGLFFSILLALPFILTNVEDMSVTRVGQVMFLTTLTYILGTVINVFLIKKQTIRRIVNVGLFSICLGATIFLLDMLFLHHELSVVSPFALSIAMLGIGIILPASKAGAITARDRYVGTASSLMKFFQSIGCVVFTKVTAYHTDHLNITLLVILLWSASFFLFFFFVLVPKGYSKFLLFRQRRLV